LFVPHRRHYERRFLAIGFFDIDRRRDRQGLERQDLGQEDLEQDLEQDPDKTWSSRGTSDSEGAWRA
jgi:hypothetical protein